MAPKKRAVHFLRFLERQEMRFAAEICNSILSIARI